jgi:acetyl esterase/lipase
LTDNRTWPSCNTLARLENGERRPARHGCHAPRARKGKFNLTSPRPSTITTQHDDTYHTQTKHPTHQILSKGHIPPLQLPTPQNIPKYRTQLARSRARFNGSLLATSLLPNPQTWTEHSLTLPTRDGSSLPTRLYVPTHVRHSTPLACLVHFHGGGWFMGDLDTEALDCRVLVSRLPLAIFDVGYRLYPDVPFPVPIHDAFDAVKHIASHGPKLAASLGEGATIDLTRGFLVGGSSGGGTYATIAAHLARDEGLTPPITGVYAACPIFSAEKGGDLTGMFPGRYDSWERHKDNFLMNFDMYKAIRGKCSMGIFHPTIPGPLSSSKSGGSWCRVLWR